LNPELKKRLHYKPFQDNINLEKEKHTSTPAAGYPNAAHCSIQAFAELLVGHSISQGKIRPPFTSL
jgi:hypothetical protein